jgi:hypothetical protein
VRWHYDYKDKQNQYHAAATVYAENVNFKTAIEWQEKALRDAKPLGIPLTTLDAQLAECRNRQAIFNAGYEISTLL